MNLPPIGFGCSPFRPGGRWVDLEAAVTTALAVGYRLLDTAELYGNERQVGRALDAPTSPPRRDVVVVGKAWRTSFRPDRLRAACEASLLRLGLAEFDLYLLHAPEAWRHVAPLGDVEELGRAELERRALPREADGRIASDDVAPSETWGAMVELAERGLATAIGVSNFSPTEIEQLGHPRPSCNEIEHHPLAMHADTVAWCRKEGIALLGHSPLSTAGVLELPEVTSVARRIGRSPAQVLLRWCLQKGLTPLPSSGDERHLRENLEALRFTLDDAAMTAIDASSAGGRA